jgi:hypothetical protein
MSKVSRDDFLDLLAESDTKTRKSSLRIVGGKVSEDDTQYIHEQLDFVDSDQTVREIDLVSSRTCSFGHLLDRQVRLVSRCEVCGAYTCSASEDDGYKCSYTCVRCGKAICKKCSSLDADKEAYCPKCKWYRNLMAFFSIVKTVVK